MINQPDSDLEEQLPLVGFDAVLTKPILIDDIIAHTDRLRA
jgi:hypothetical protein